MSTENIQLRRVSVDAPAMQVGDFRITEKADPIYRLTVRLPGEGAGGTWMLRKTADVNGPVLNERTWNWDGNFDEPTIIPSLWHTGVWHGVVTKGFARSAGAP